MSKLYIAVLCLALAACSDNLFGSGGGNNCGDDIKCWRLKAENEFRNGDYKAAHDSYKKIVEIDPTASIGYFGMAKAGLWMEGINPFDVFRYVNTDDDSIPFVDPIIEIRNRYLQGMRAAAIPLSKLKRRDSLTILYELHQKNDPANRSDSLSEFRREFCGNSKTGACYDNAKTPREPFPLSDREYKYNSYYGGLLISTMAKTLLEFFDTNNDSCITRRGEKKLDNPGDPQKDQDEWKKWGCKKLKDEEGNDKEFDYDLSVELKKDATGNFSIDWSQVFEDGELEPSQIEDINKKIDDFSGDMDDVIGIMNINGDGTGDSWQDELNKYKNYASFYKVGTRLDEDGDGCFDEELLNKLDNDGDGITGEDARLASLVLDTGSTSIWGKIGVNHVFMYNEDPDDPRNLPMLLPQNAKEYICNEPAPDCPDKRTNLRPNEDGDIIVIGFTQERTTDGREYWTTDSLELKLEVAQDTKCGSLKYGLEKRKNLVGGCWLFYNEEQFKRIWLNRHSNNCCGTGTDLINSNCAKERD
jgi:hypothetical protein